MIPPQQGLPFSPRLPDLVEVGGFDSQRDQFLAFHDANPVSYTHLRAHET